MSSIVIALPKIEDAKKIRSVLERHGFTVASVCSTASSALSNASELGSGVLICGHRLPDMNYLDLSECLPRDFEMLLLASARVICEVPSSILSVEMPIKSGDLVNTVSMILMQQDRKRRKEKKKPKLRTERVDVEQMYEEMDHEDKTGFFAELTNLTGKVVYVVFYAGETKSVHVVNLQPTVILRKKIEKYAQKGMRYWKSQGSAALAGKIANKIKTANSASQSTGATRLR